MEGITPSAGEISLGTNRDGEAHLMMSAEDSVAAIRSNPRLSRRRTKTGCLTCRRRRIKCGEERPTCANCIKSKRECEGYNQRVIFKDPLNTYRGPASNIATHSGFVVRPTRQSVPSGSHGPPATPNALSGASPHSILPRSRDPSQVEPGRQQLPTAAFQGFIYNDPATFQPQHNVDNSSLQESDIGYSAQQAQLSAQWENRLDSKPLPSPLGTKDNSTFQPRQNQYEHTDPETCEGQVQATHASYFDNSQKDKPLHTDAESANSNGPFHEAQEALERPQQQQSQSAGLDNVDQMEDYQQGYKTSDQNDAWSYSGQPSLSLAHEPATSGMLYANESYGISNPLHKMDEDDEDDPFDVTDDEDPDTPRTRASFDSRTREIQRHTRDSELAIVMAVQAAQTREETRIRTFHSVIENYGPNMLANYIPSSRDSPLSNPISAGIFCHFVNVIAPSLSMFERHPANPSIVFRGNPVPKSQQHIWSYTMPTIALRNHALCHAMLAMASLHIAKLVNAPITVSLKHYHIAIRKLAKNVGSSLRRKHLSTFATTLLLGFYEVISADHSKWCDHLLGAHQLVKQIDFAGMTRYLKAKKVNLKKLSAENLYSSGNMVVDAPVVYGNSGMSGIYQSIDDEVDENLVGIIMGKQIKYAAYGEVIDDPNESYTSNKTYTQRELEMFDTQQDLFWWYTKQDIFQSILSQNRLFLNYERWSHCPPRAPLGRRDAVYGTFDHLVLLLGRLCSFAAKDLRRKKRAMAANRGQWRPPNASGEPPLGPPRPTNAHSQRGPMPPLPSFPGMLPGMGNASLPRGFSPSSEDSPPPNSDEGDEHLDEQTAKAEEEWLGIRSVFGMLEQHLGPDFAPLGPEYAQEIHSPFGPAIQYRTYGIAVLWLTYYLGLIVCHRSHPTMPPSAMIAAGFAAQQTKLFANIIGRISAGIAADTSTATRVNIGTGAALTDSCFALFVAGVQIQDQAQRTWIIQRMLDVERLTGFETASHIAKGCEVSWMRAADMGRGPPYSRYTELVPVDQVWNRAGQRLDRMLISAGEDIHINPRGTERIGRVQFAVGILGVTDHFGHLDLQSDDEMEN